MQPRRPNSKNFKHPFKKNGVASRTDKPVRHRKGTAGRTTKAFKPKKLPAFSTELTYPVRINKWLAFNNYATRRGADELVDGNKVTINGRRAVLGDMVNLGDAVVVANQKRPKEYVYYAFNKPRGMESTHIDFDSKVIRQAIHLNNVFPIGRLDKDSHGLLILTNDGRITDRLLNPGYAHDKEYVVAVKEDFRNNFKEKMEGGVFIEGYTTAPCKVNIINPRTFSVILSEGKKHQIRRMVVACFNQVEDLKRVRILNILLGSLQSGHIRRLEGDELTTFLKTLGM
jgi:23S rRNA pseudouridine2604 synthase